MTIRSAAADDFDAIATITNHYIRTTTIHWNYDPVTPEELREQWMEKRERYPCLVAVEPGSNHVIGYAKAGPWRDRAAYQHTAEIGVYLAAEVHGRGLGRRLYEALIEECRRCGFHALVAGIALPNAGSIRLHETLGFRRIGEFREVGWKFDGWRDSVFYQLLL